MFSLATYTEMPDALVITTNGFVKKNGECVMGRGCAKIVAERWKEVPLALGNKITKKGNRVNLIGQIKIEDRKFFLVSFPVKPVTASCKPDKSNVVYHMREKFKNTECVPGWACLADLAIIEESAKQLVELTNKKGWEMVVVPRPGIGAGELSWEVVRPVIYGLLDDRFHCIALQKS
jgi:hypothetical protein